MRFPSLIRLPKNKQYQIKPRYYDPVKEEIAERTERIRQEMKGEISNMPSGRITFERKAAPLPSSSMLQLIIITILLGLIVGWLYVGNDIIYFIFALAPVYLWVRFRKAMNRNR